MMKKKLFLTMAAILLLCVGVITVYAVGQPADAEPAQAADKQAAGAIVDEQAQRVDVLDVLNVQDFTRRCMEKANAQQKAALAEISKKDWEIYQRKALQIIGQLPEDQPRLTEEKVIELGKLHKGMDLVKAINDVAGAPDLYRMFSGRYDMVFYYLDDEGKDKVAVTLMGDYSYLYIDTVGENGETVLKDGNGKVIHFSAE